MVNGRPVEAFWRIGPVWFQEISFVTVPSDTDARVRNKQVQLENLKVLGGESKRYGEIILQEHVTDFDNLKRMWSIPVKVVESAEVADPPITTGNTPLAYVRDEKYGVEYPLFSVEANTTKDIYNSILSSNFPEKYKDKLYIRLARFCKDNKVDVPDGLEESYQHMETSKKDESTQPVYIPLDSSTYPLLYTLIDAIGQNAMEVSMENTEKTAEETVVETAVVEETTTTTEKTDESAPVVTETTITEVTQLKETIDQLNEQIDVLNEKCIGLLEESHLRLASEVAILSNILRRPVARNKSLEDVARDLSKRTTQSLEDTLSDLLLEFDGSAPVNIESVEKIESPVIQTNESDTTTTEEPKGKVGDLKESEQESYYLHFGLDPKKLEKRLKEMQQSI